MRSEDGTLGVVARRFAHRIGIATSFRLLLLWRAELVPIFAVFRRTRISGKAPIGAAGLLCSGGAGLNLETGLGSC